MAEYKKTIYSFWKNGQMICKGSAKEVCEHVGLSESRLYHLAGRNDRRVRVEGKLVRIYEIYEADGTVIFKGQEKECVEKLFISPKSFSRALRDMKTGLRTGRQGAELIRFVGYEYRAIGDVV